MYLTFCGDKKMLLSNFFYLTTSSFFILSVLGASCIREGKGEGNIVT